MTFTQVFLLIIFGVCFIYLLVFTEVMRSIVSTRRGREIYFKKKIKTPFFPTGDFNPAYSSIIPFYQKLSYNDKLRFHERVLSFLQNYEIHPRENLTLMQADRELIAASYIKLTWGYKDFLVNSFKYIIVYPDAYFFEHNKQLHEGHFNPSQKVIMLAWNYFVDGYTRNDGKNLGLHEFTHAVTMAFLSKKNQTVSADLFRSYSKQILVLTRDFYYLQYLRNQNLLRNYAFENPIELLAVLVETYFETPERIRTQAPELFSYTEKMLGYHKLFDK